MVTQEGERWPDENDRLRGAGDYICRAEPGRSDWGPAVLDHICLSSATVKHQHGKPVRQGGSTPSPEQEPEGIWVDLRAVGGRSRARTRIYRTGTGCKARCGPRSLYSSGNLNILERGLRLLKARSIRALELHRASSSDVCESRGDLTTGSGPGPPGCALGSGSQRGGQASLPRGSAGPGAGRSPPGRRGALPRALWRRLAGGGQSPCAHSPGLHPAGLALAFLVSGLASLCPRDHRLR